MRGTLTRIVSLVLLLSASAVAAKEAPASMHEFNVKCPTKALAPVLDRAYHECNNGYDIADGSCQKFVDVYRQLLPEYDCQRPFDAGPKPYIVPAIWLVGDAAMEDYVRLLWRMASQKDKMFRDKFSNGSFSKAVSDARVLFASVEFRNTLDGALAEEYVGRTKQIERELKHAADSGKPHLK
jgi:hypothetical protein